MDDVAAGRRRDLLVVLATAVAAIAIESAWVRWYDYPRRRSEATASWGSRLTTIADDRDTTIEAWVRERQGDVRLVATDPHVVAAAGARSGAAGADAALVHAVNSPVQYHRYESVYVLDEGGEVVAKSEGSVALDRGLHALAVRAMDTAEPIVDFCRLADGRPVVAAAARVKCVPAAARCGSVLLVRNPRMWLYPMMASDAVGAASGELIIARREGDSVLALTPLRHLDAPPMTVRRPVAETAWAIPAAISGKTAFLVYTDYRRVPVLGATRLIAGTSWGLTAKLDVAEALAPARRRSIRLLLFVAGATLLLISTAFVVLRSRRMRALREADRHYRNLFEHSVNGIVVAQVIFDAEGRPVDHRFVAANPAFERLTGTGAGGRAGKTSAGMSIRWPPSELRQLYDVAMSGKPIQYERFNDLLGRWYDTSVFSPQRGQFAYLFTDITDRKAAEIRLRESEENYRRIVETTNEGICVVDAANRAVYVNRRMAEMVGREPADIVGRDVVELVPEDERASHERQVAERRAGQPALYERRLLRPDGTVIDCIVSVVPVLDSEGRVDGSLAMFTDVTDMYVTESRLRRLAAAVEQLSEAILIVDPAGKVEYVNPAFEAITGYSREETVGKHWRFLESCCASEATIQELRQVLLRGETWRGTTKNVRKSGEVFDAEGTVSIVRDRTGRIVNFVGVARDVTRERALGAQLNQAQKMEAVGTLAGGVAHDFNNLMQGMLMFLQVVAKTHALPQKTVSLLGEIQKLVIRGRALTRQLLLFSRKDVARPELLDLNEVIRETAALLRRLIRENVRFDIGLAGGALPVTADRTQLEQALVNLVVNAADAMPDGGQLRLSSGRDHDRCWVSVEDSGHGIAPGIRDRIFEPFFTTKGQERGSGLGLAVVHGIITEHGGTIEFDDRPGGGTRFRVSLPAASAGADFRARLETPQPAMPDGGGERVLVVEDEDSVREGLIVILQDLGYETVAVDSGEHALALPDSAPFALALIDVVLPGMSGVEALRHLRQRWPSMRAIFMSGYTGGEEPEAATGEPMLEKPFDATTLSSALRTALDR